MPPSCMGTSMLWPLSRKWSREQQWALVAAVGVPETPAGAEGSHEEADEEADDPAVVCEEPPVPIEVEPAIVAEPCPPQRRMSRFLALRLVYGTASQKDLAATSR